MADLTKIATCSYCGTRSILRLAGKVQHELACASCGARLHTMKALKTTTAPGPSARQPSRAAPQRRKPTRKARRKPMFAGLRDMLDDIWDEVEDFFD